MSFDRMQAYRQAVDREMARLGATAAGELRERRYALRRPQEDYTPPPMPITAPRNVDPMASSENAPVTDTVPVQSVGGVSYRIIGVLMRTYILVEADDALLLIDQHAAHERLQYERYMAQLEAGMGSQQLLTPLVLHVTAREMALIQENMDLLTEAGYSVEPFGECDIQVRAVPHILGRAELKPAFMDTIGALYRLRSATVELRRAEIMQMACKSAVKGGEVLSDGEVDTLIRRMLETGAPPTCPHGRPVMKSITRRELEKMFKRIQ